MYIPHSSKKLIEHFKDKPWQGTDPMRATFLFVGLDANYDANIETMLPEIDPYLNDGVNWWKTNKEGVHHPFRLPCYRGDDGRRYHGKFAEIGFKPENAELVSFVELLHLPTTGRSPLEVNDLLDKPEKVKHLLKINDAILNGSARYIFISGSVGRLMRASGKFTRLPQNPLRTDGHLKVLHEANGRIIYEMYHLSCYGWQLVTLNAQIAQIHGIVWNFIGDVGAIRSGDYWFKAVEMLQHNWALIDVEPDGSCIVHFVHDGSGKFDEMKFISEQEAQRQLKLNGFRRCAENTKAQEFITAPKPPFHKGTHPNGLIYSSGRFWNH